MDKIKTSGCIGYGLIVIIFLSVFSIAARNTNAAGAVYYVAVNGSDSNAGSSAAPFATISKALSGMSSGDTLVVKNGLYADLPGMLVNDHYSASIPNNVTIQAETPYGVRLKWTKNLNYYDAPVLIEKASGVHVDGFIYEMLNLEDPQYVVELDGNGNTVTRTIVKRNMVDAYGGWYAIIGNDNLIEDAAGVGAARYGFYMAGPDATTQRDIFRRCVGRMDFANTAQPKATFAFYGNNAGTSAGNALFQNCVAIDGHRPSANGGEEKYGGFYNPKNAAGIAIQGSIVLNEDAGHAGIFSRELSARDTTIIDTVVWDIRGFSWSAGIRGNGSGGFWNNQRLTIGNAPSVYYNQDSASPKTFTNSVFLGGMPLTTAGDYGWSTYQGNQSTTIAQIGFLPRPLTNQAGANIVYRYGTDGTHWGTGGYDQLTGAALWPWPYEDKIAAVFGEQLDTPAGYTPAGNVSKRGFAAGGTGLYSGQITLTSYIWEYLGNPCPADICRSSVSSPSPAADTAAPTVPANLTAVAVNSNQINLSWTASTDNVAVTGYKIFRNGVQVGSPTTSLSYQDTGLSVSTAYSYTVLAYDAAGNNSAQSAAATATTQAAAVVDTTPPSVSISVPVSGATVSATVAVSANASDNVGVAGVQFKLDGQTLGAEDTASPFSVSWDTTVAQNGSHVLTAVARDAAGNTSTSAAVTVTVANNIPAPFLDTIPPSVPTGLTATAVNSSQINLSWTASTDNVAVTGYKIFRNGVQIATSVSTTYYQNIGLTPATAYSYIVSAYDAAGNNSAQSAAATATTQAAAVVDTTPPSVSISVPVSGATVSATVAVSANASDNVGVAGVQFLIDNQKIGGAITSPPYSVSWITTSFANGSHSISAVASDLAGNNTTSNPVVVTVANKTATPAPVGKFITKFLFKGIRDSQVKILQQALFKDGETSVGSTATDFFGSQTEKTLKQFQIKYGIVSSGNPFTTGYGATGPATRVKLNQIISGYQATMPVPAPAPTSSDLVQPSFQSVASSDKNQKIIDLQNQLQNLLNQVKILQEQLRILQGQ